MNIYTTVDVSSLIPSKEECEEIYFELTDHSIPEDAKRRWGGIPGVSHSPDHCAAISEALMGHKQSEETKKKRMESRKGYKHSEQTKQKIAKANTGKSRKHTEETKKKISENGVGMRGKRHSEETRIKIAAAQKLRHEKRRSENII